MISSTKGWTFGGHPLRRQDIERQLERMLAALTSIEPEPLSEMMAAQGCPPSAGWVMFLPARWREEIVLPALLPSYVRFSEAIEAPVLVMQPSLF